MQQFLHINIVTRESVANERRPFLQILAANEIHELWYLHFIYSKQNITLQQQPTRQLLKASSKKLTKE